MHFGFSQSARRPEGYVIFIAIGVIAIAITALIGWDVGNAVLTSVFVGAVALQPTTAISLIVGALGLIAGATNLRWISRVAGVVLLSVCAIWLAAYASPHTVPIDLLLFRNQVLVQRPVPMWPGRPSSISCAVIALFAASWLGVGARPRQLGAGSRRQRPVWARAPGQPVDPPVPSTSPVAALNSAPEPAHSPEHVAGGRRRSALAC